MVEIAGTDGPPKREKDFLVPKPEQIGFRQIQRDVLPSGATAPDDQLEKVTKLGIDTTRDRKSRWERALTGIGTIEQNRDKRGSIINQLNEFIESERASRNPHGDLVDVFDFAKSVLTSFRKPPALKLVLERGARRPMQEIISVAGNLAEARAQGDLELSSVIIYSMELARELYAQEHGGQFYRSTKREEEIRKAEERSKNTRVQ